MEDVNSHLFPKVRRIFRGQFVFASLQLGFCNTFLFVCQAEACEDIKIGITNAAEQYYIV